MNSIITMSKSTYHHADDEDETVEVDNENCTSLSTNLASIVALNSPSLASVPMGYKRQMFGEDDIRVEIRNGMESLVYDPYNPLNKLVTPVEIETLLRHYGIDVPIQHFEFYKRAFVHRSYTKSPLLLNPHSSSSTSTTTEVTILPQPTNCLPLYTKSNERLEFVGDGVLECITKFYLYRRFPKENEGFMTEKKIALVKNEAIGRIAYEMGLHKWFILSKNVEEKQTRTNLKKLGCLFEAFLGALFLDFNKVSVKDEDGWFRNVFLTGPGFQMVQIFIENVFEKHVNWIDLIRNDDNYKNILQVRIQKTFKVTPDYLEIQPYQNDIGYHMGVYLCLGQSIHGLTHAHALPLIQFPTFQSIHEYMSVHGKIFIFLGEGNHKIKKKAEQMACEHAVQATNPLISPTSTTKTNTNAP
jgi:dsRNA-specific ribonuclease